MTFQRLMDIVLCPHHTLAAAYLDDAMVHSSTWAKYFSTSLRWNNTFRININTPSMYLSMVGWLLPVFCTQLLFSFSPVRPHQEGMPREGEVDTWSRAGVPGPEVGPHQHASPPQPQL